MKIMLFVSAMGSGGAERVAATLVNAWAERGDDVTLVATFSQHRPVFYKLSEHVRVVHLAQCAVLSQRSPVRYVSRVLALRKLIRDIGPDVLVSFLPNVCIMTILASRGLGVPMIACEHNNPSVDGRSRLWTLLCRIFYPRASLVTVLSESIVVPLRKMVPGARSVEVMPNPLPNELFEQGPLRKDAAGRKRVVAVGRLTAQKQFDVLIDSFANVAREHDNVDLWIWGEGEDRASLEAQIERLQMKDRIFLPGTTKTLWKEMVCARAFALSSRYEGLPMALMESLALGVPCIAFDCPSGPRELTRDGRDGLLVPAGDVKGLTEGLRRLVSDDGLCQDIGRRAASSMWERYGLPAVLPKWDQLFARIGAGAVSRSQDHVRGHPAIVVSRDE
jgi:glycosyltransferase involved in cell wall biosynthesis